jgi:hypothetical protein
MANLKVDLLNELRNQKYFGEIELIRLAGDPTMNYKAKIAELDSTLTEIALVNQKIGLAEMYFQEPVAAPAPAPQADPSVTQPPVAPAPAVLPGQSHGE